MVHYCEKCGFGFFAEDTKIIHSSYGVAFAICPNCGDKVPAEEKNIKITPNNVTFPQHFFYFGGGYNLSKNEIQKYVDKLVNRLKKSKIGEFASFSTGDTLVCGFRNQDGIVVYVSKNYYETEVEL